MNSVSSKLALNVAQTRLLAPYLQRSLKLLRICVAFVVIGSPFHPSFALGTIPIGTEHKIPNVHRKIEDGGNFSFHGFNNIPEKPLNYGYNAEAPIRSESLLKVTSQVKSLMLTKPVYISRPIQLVAKFHDDNIPSKAIKNLIGQELPKTKAYTTKKFFDYSHLKDHFKMGPTEIEPSRIFRTTHHHEHHWGPFFEEHTSSKPLSEGHVSAVHLFTEAALNCRVGMLKDKTVMWIRRTAEKVSLLTVGNITYSGDPRIQVKYQYPNNWRLLINPTQRDDAGIYMCQVSTHPPRFFTTNLTILEPPLRIIDENERNIGDRYYKSGSTVDLQCQVSRNFFEKEQFNIFKALESPKYINQIEHNGTSNENIFNSTTNIHNFTGKDLEKHFSNFITWAKDEKLIQNLTKNLSSVSGKWLTSRISIGDAKLSDSGNYSCSLGKLFTVIVQVQVLTGEIPAAVQHNKATRSEYYKLVQLNIFFMMIKLYNVLN
ncbi:uncharacterized protein dpr18 isoform X2 [Drosophila bipectinata]|uniref:uncharacterized protein dpr18 isoform X2 n=1 Tax=Drosophila bipectinata TaxID=42026 RepID=UPI001C88FAB2|nr:uncharacterized protein LOC108126814 isoform X2 [Drosophila bipectinata]